MLGELGEIRKVIRVERRGWWQQSDFLRLGQYRLGLSNTGRVDRELEIGTDVDASRSYKIMYILCYMRFASAVPGSVSKLSSGGRAQIIVMEDSGNKNSLLSPTPTFYKLLRGKMEMQVRPVAHVAVGTQPPGDRPLI